LYFGVTEPQPLVTFFSSYFYLFLIIFKRFLVRKSKK